MDMLQDLPFSNDKTDTLSTETRSVIEKYLGAGASSDKQEVEPTAKWKLVVCILVVFLVLVNPITQTLFTNLPFIGSSDTTVLASTFIMFTIAIVGIVYYV